MILDLKQHRDSCTSASPSRNWGDELAEAQTNLAHPNHGPLSEASHKAMQLQKQFQSTVIAFDAMERNLAKSQTVDFD